jgi:DNA ligase-1
MEPWEIIKHIETDNSRLFKEDVLKQHMDNEEFVKGLQKCFDPLITFGTREVPVKKEPNGLMEPWFTWSQFEQLCYNLETRTLTGHAARDAILNAMAICDQTAWNFWYRRILLKSIDAGFGERTINKIAKGTIPRFSCMLAKDGKDGKGLVGKCLIEYKYDGVRCIAIVKNNVATLYSRNGKVFPNFPHIEAALSKPEFNDCVFDGEIMSENFQALMKQVYRKSDVQTEDAFMALFDIVDLQEWEKGKGQLNTLERKEILDNMVFEDCIKPVDYTMVNFDTENGNNTFKAMNKEALEKGYEGLMVKPIESLYECKRSASWLKIKPIIEVTLMVEAIEEGQGKFIGTTGALVCEGVDDGVNIKVNVGSGLTDELRDAIWNNQEDVLHQLVEIRADAITQNEDGNYSLRFPRFKTFRGFEIGEKI